MKTVFTRFAALFVAGAALLGSAAAAENFDLKLELAVPAGVQPGDVIRVELLPDTQYGRTNTTAPIVFEKPATTHAGEIVFKKALAPDQIYRLKVEIVRPGKDGRPTVRYVTALDRTARRPAETALKLRLFQAGTREARDNHVFLVQDKDGVYRVMLFAA